MAGNTKQNKKQSANQKNSQKKQTTPKKVTKQKEQEAEEFSFASEMVVWIICAIMLIIELGNFGLCGFINHISYFLFGIFGVIEYILPLVIMFAVFFLHVNEYKKRAVKKVVFGFCVLLCFGMIGQMITGLDDFSISGLYLDGYQDKIGGGVLCGSIAYFLQATVGYVGTYIILLLAIILCVVLFAEISVIDFVKDMIWEEDEEEGNSPQPKKKEAKKRKILEKSEEIIKEDTPKNVFNRKKKKSSVLDAISVLPAEADQGILPSKVVDKLPENEEVHEIKLEYELDLPGENMGDFLVSEVEKEVIKSPFETKKTKKKKPIVPIVQSEEKEDKPKVKPEVITEPVSKLEDQIVVQEEKKEPEKPKNIEKPKEPEEEVSSASVMQMENKTAKQTQNVSAKVVSTSESDYQFPPLELLKKGKSQTATNDETVRNNAMKLQDVLKSFGVNVTMTNYSCGPSVTRYEMVPEQGVKVSKITGLADDIMMNLAAQSIRIEAPIPGKSAVGIEIPNGTRSAVGFRELIDTEKFIKHPSKLAVAVGKDIEGNVVVEDIAKMPHLLIAGATGSGKSVCTNTLIMSILYKAHPDEVKLILIDPKQVELKVYNGIPHLLTPVVTDPKKAAGALNWAVAEMTKRYQMFSECNVRNIQGYNAKVKEVANTEKVPEEQLEKMSQIVIIVDELADLMMVAKAEVEEAIVRLAQLARAAGIHLVIATQRPSVDVVTGLIKANVPSRIALSVSSGVDSRTIIDSVGAEKLLGNGDMLFYPTMYPKPVRVQGAYISDDEVLSVVEFLKTQNGENTYNEEVSSQITSSSSSAVAINGSGEDERDEYFVQAGKFIINKDKASIGMLQRMFKIGFNRAARIMDQLFEAGVVGPEEGTKPRQVLMSEEQFDAYIENGY